VPELVKPKRWKIPLAILGGVVAAVMLIGIALLAFGACSLPH